MNLCIRNILGAIGGGMILWAAVAPAQAGIVPQVPPELQGLIEEALTHNENLRSLEAEVAASRQEVPAAGSLPDPMLGFGVANLPIDTFDFSQEPMTQKQVFVSQRIPWFGKLNLKEKRAALRVLQQEALLAAKRLEIARMVSVTFYELAFVERSLAVNGELAQMVEQMLRVAEAGYASGRNPQQDVFQGQVELGGLMEEKITLEQRQRTLEDQLHEMLSRKDFLSVARPDALALPPQNMSKAQLKVRALATNPLLHLREVDIRRAEVDIALARKDYYPDMDFRLGYGQRDQDRNGKDLADFFSATVTVNLPVWRHTKQDKLLEAAQNRRKAALSAHENLRRSLPHRVDALVTEIEALRENHRLFTEALLLQTDQWSRASLAAYEVGKIPFDTMINAHLRRLRFGLQADQFRFSVLKRLAELEELAGGEAPNDAATAPDPESAGVRPPVQRPIAIEDTQ